MIAAALELYVEVRPGRARSPSPGDADAVLAALRRDPRRRNALALEALRAASAGAEVVLCPGWTFVGRLPRAAIPAAREATVVLETVAEGPARVWALRRGVASELPAQVFERSGELDTARSAETVGAPLAAAVNGPRALPEAVVLVGGEVNVVRREPRGGRVEYGWDPGVAAAGLRSTALARKVVLNPSRVPVGSYIRDKRRHGPWAALVSVANRLDSRRLGGRNFPAPAQAVARGAELAPVGADVLSDGESRVVWYELP